MSDTDYEYRVFPLPQTLEVFAGPIEPDSYLARDKMTTAILDALRDGFRWVRSDSGWAIFEKANCPIDVYAKIEKVPQYGL